MHANAGRSPFCVFGGPDLSAFGLMSCEHRRIPFGTMFGGRSNVAQDIASAW